MNACSKIVPRLRIVQSRAGMHQVIETIHRGIASCQKQQEAMGDINLLQLLIGNTEAASQVCQVQQRRAVAF